MRRVFAAVPIVLLFTAGLAHAADAVALAAQQEAEERQRRLAATIEEVQAAQMAQQRQISALAAEVNRLREELAKSNRNAAFEDSLRRLSEQIVKVDEARLADNQKIYDALEKLGGTIKSLPLQPVRPRPANIAVPAAASAPLEGDFYEYTVRPGDTLSEIVQAYNQQKIPVTLKGIMEANPGLVPEKISVGQKIFVPKTK